MNNNQATLEKMERMGLWGMHRALRATLDSPRKRRDGEQARFGGARSRRWPNTGSSTARSTWRI